ncbi:virulence plasmid 65kDa B protein-domain-containing protein, partial [Lasiosphaeria miniovina]
MAASPSLSLPGNQRLPPQPNPGPTSSPFFNNPDGQEATRTSPSTTGSAAQAFPPDSGLRAIQQSASKLSVDAATGALSLGIPLVIPSGRDGFSPGLELVYDSNAGNGPFGVGWSLSLPSISRKTSRCVPRYRDGGSDEDVFLLSDGAGELVAQEGALTTVDSYKVQRYKPRVQTGDSASRIERWTDTAGSHVFWRTISSTGITTIYGKADAEQIFHDNESVPSSRCAYSWLATETYDPKGNCVVFEYKTEDAGNVNLHSACERHRTAAARSADRYLKRVRWGNRRPNRDLDTWEVLKGDSALSAAEFYYEVVFDYGDHHPDMPGVVEANTWPVRADPFSTYVQGFEVRTYRLCRRILVFHHFKGLLGIDDCLVSSLLFQYNESPAGSRLVKCTRQGHVPLSGGDGSGYTTESLAPQEFHYSGPILGPGINVELLQPTTLSTANLPNMVGMPGRRSYWLDLDNEGSPGLLAELAGGGWSYQRNESPRNSPPVMAEFGPPESLAKIPALLQQDGFFAHLDSDGCLQYVSLDEQGRPCGYHERLSSSNTWGDFVPFPHALSFDPHGLGFCQIDLTGCGRQDVVQLMTGDCSDRLRWYPSLARGGFASGITCPGGPRVPLPETELMALLTADMTGDGLVDVVQVSRSGIQYWPNLGHGRFGAVVQMDNAPVADRNDQFTTERLRLVDMTGSGTADFVYFVPGGGAHVYFNLVGNGWSERVSISSVPDIRTMLYIDAVDILGHGMGALCWTAVLPSTGALPTVQYLDLMGNEKPGMLTRFRNGLGAETTVGYCPSTKFYSVDREAGRSWTTKLPFPVQCVQTMTTVDRVAQTTQKTTYAYHDGFYNSFENEFCGFGRVDEWHQENLAAGPALSRFTTPRTHVVTWFHTGAVSSLTPSHTFARSSVPPLEPCCLPDSVSMSAAERREALRALKGHVVRTEVYGEDDAPGSGLPYTVTETSFASAVVSPTVTYDQPHACFRVVDRESLITHYERNMAEDARVEHQLCLAVNEFGQCTKRAVIHYGRRNPLADLCSDTQAMQQGTILQYFEQDLTNHIDDPDCFFLSLLSESRTYVLRGFQAPEPRFGYEKLAASDDPGLSSTLFCKVLVAKERVYYRSSDLSRRLPKGQIERFSAPGQTYQLASTAGLRSDIFTVKGRDLLTGVTLADGGYVDLDGDGCWWIPNSLLRFISPLASGATTDAASELRTARSHFYISTYTIDRFGSVSHSELDPTLLFRTRFVDAVGNETSYEYDYIAVAPAVQIDENENRTQIAYDGFGVPVGTAPAGKKGEGVGDTLDGFQRVLDTARLMDFVRNPVRAAPKLLGSTGTRCVHNRRAFYLDSGVLVPAFEAVLRRENWYLSDRGRDSKISISITYLDGRGNPIQTVDLHSLVPNTLWRVGAWSIHDGVGRVRLSFLPRLADSHLFCPRTEHEGVPPPSTRTFHDPVGRAIAVLHPDHTWEKTVIRAWSTTQYDAGDTVLVQNPAEDGDVGGYFRHGADSSSYLPSWYAQHKGGSASEQAAAIKSEIYHDTPDVSHLDPAGRAVAWVAAADSAVQQTSRAHMDAAANVGGIYWSLPDASGYEWLRWTQHGAGLRSRVTRDKQRRFVGSWLQDSPDALEKLIVRKEYGEGQPDDVARNLRGKQYRTCDQAGTYTHALYDFQGNCVRRETKFATVYSALLDWSTGQASPGGVAPETYVEKGEFDAFRREYRSIASDGTIWERTYTHSGGLSSLRLDEPSGSSSGWTSYISDIRYTAGMQPEYVAYGNGVESKFIYSMTTLRPKRSKMWRSKTALRDISYSHDCLGRVCYTKDMAQQDVYFRNAVIRPENDYTYDARGQLVTARGREQFDPATEKLDPYSAKYTKTSHGIPGDGSQVCAYIETTAYDVAGNITSVKHESADSRVSGWTRAYRYEDASCLDGSGATSNRLTSTSVGKVEERYKYNEAGCAVRVPGVGHLSWDFANRLRSSVSLSGTPKSEVAPETKTWYVYNAAGARVRVVTERTAGNGTSPPRKIKETFSLATYELSRRYSGSGQQTTGEVATTRAVGDDPATPVALIEATSWKATDTRLVRFLLDEGLEVDDEGRIISFEEYSPYGATTYRAVSSRVEAPAKYRYAHYCRDETGLYHCGMRYYAAWLGRWTSPDPMGTLDGLNLYSYVGNDPVGRSDPSGGQGKNKHKTRKAVPAEGGTKEPLGSLG